MEQEIKISTFWKRSFRTIKEDFGGSFHDVVHQAQIDTNKLIAELAELRKANERLTQVEQRHNELLKLMQRAKRMAIMQVEEEESPRFRMDANGNLTRIED